MFHGDADLTVTIDSATFVLFGLINVTTIEGSNYIAERMDNVGIDHCYHVTPGGGHVPYLGDAGEYDYTLSLMSGFMQGLICDTQFDCTYHEINDLSIGTNEIAAIEQINVFPNPADQEIFIQQANSQTTNTLYSLDGRKIADIVGASLNTSTLEDGVYIVQSVGNGMILTRERVIISH